MKPAKLWSIGIALATALALLSGCAAPAAATVAATTAANAPSVEATASPTPAAQATPSPTAAGAPAELLVSAAASLTDVLKEIATAYAAVAPQVKLTFTFGSSGTLQTQIEEGAPADLFFSAGKKQMKALEEKKLLLEGTNTELLQNKIVLIVPAASALGLKSFDDVAAETVKLVALGEAKSVPVGQYSEQVFTNLGTWDKVKAKANFGSDVRQVLTWVEGGEVDCGVVYATDAMTTDKVKVVAEAPEGSSDKVIYPAAVLATSKNADAAEAFLAFLQGEEAKKLFAKYGFTNLK